MKRVLTFIFILVLWFLSTFIISSSNSYYQSLNLPFFAPHPIIFTIVWSILYVMITKSIYDIYTEYNYRTVKEYNKVLLINYLSNQLFSFAFFGLKSPFLGFVITVIVFISSLYLYYETKKLNVNSSKWLIPYIIWNIFAVILSLTVYFMNF